METAIWLLETYVVLLPLVACMAWLVLDIRYSRSSASLAGYTHESTPSAVNIPRLTPDAVRRVSLEPMLRRLEVEPGYLVRVRKSEKATVPAMRRAKSAALATCDGATCSHTVRHAVAAVKPKSRQPVTSEFVGPRGMAWHDGCN